MAKTQLKKLGVLTSGGDAQGMNAALRAVVRTGIAHSLDVYAIYEGYQGMVDGGKRIRKMDWDSVGGIIHKGGTEVGTARSDDFRTREGRLQAAQNLLKHNIDRLVIIGGDGSLTGANLFRSEWPSLVDELAKKGKITAETAKNHPNLIIIGLVGSIDNDFYGTDMTIGADTALHRITEAIDAITSTAASHQRTFVIKVMGRNCGYLALMSGLATGADWVLIPESQPDVDNWQELMCERLRAGRRAGRRDSIVILAEGAHDRQGNYIGSTEVQKVLEDGLGEDVRVTVLGHVQRGGSPSAYDRILGTMMGHAAVEAILEAKPNDEPMLIGVQGNRVVKSPLMECVNKTHAVAKAIEEKNYDKAMQLRTGSFIDAWHTLLTFGHALPHPPEVIKKRFRLGILNAGAPASGMNTASRAAIRLTLDKGHIALGICNGFEGLIGDCGIHEMDWMSVNGWVSMGGSELGTSRMIPHGSQLYSIARTIEKNDIHGLLVVGGWPAYEAAYKLYNERDNFPAFNIPLVCLPASINNNLPGSEFSIGADTALNNIVGAVDKLKQSAVATRRCFVIEVMGHYCGYLALMGGMATGAERVYLHEEGITIKDLTQDVEALMNGFGSGKRLGLMIRNEYANNVYTTPFICALFEEEGKDLFDVRQTILGHLQQGGDPSPFDRIQATRFARMCVDFLIQECEIGSNRHAFTGLENGQYQVHELRDFPHLVDTKYQRPKSQWWLELRSIAKLLANSR